VLVTVGLFLGDRSFSRTWAMSTRLSWTRLLSVARFV